MRILHKIIVLSLISPGGFVSAASTFNAGDAATARSAAALTAGGDSQDSNAWSDVPGSQGSGVVGSQSDGSHTIVAASLSSTPSVVGVPKNNAKTSWNFSLDPAALAAAEKSAAVRAPSLKYLGTGSADAGAVAAIPALPSISAAHPGTEAGAAPTPPGFWTVSPATARPEDAALPVALAGASAAAAAGAGAAPSASSSAGGLLPSAAAPLAWQRSAMEPSATDGEGVAALIPAAAPAPAPAPAE